MRFKHHFNHPRPADLWPFIQPLILTPGHPSYPAGHATETHLVSTVLAALLKSTLPDGQSTDTNRPQYRFVHKKEAVLFRLAERIADNRIYAGLHYPKDNKAGEILGISLAEHLLKRVGIPGLERHTDCLSKNNPGFKNQDILLKGTAPNLAWLFYEARKELAGS
jgi:membrane-associated phospholipid phosphatase